MPRPTTSSFTCLHLLKQSPSLLKLPVSFVSFYECGLRPKSGGMIFGEDSVTNSDDLLE